MYKICEFGSECDIKTYLNCASFSVIMMIFGLIKCTSFAVNGMILELNIKCAGSVVNVKAK